MSKLTCVSLICILFVVSSVSQTKLACVGNSITQGYNAPSYTEKLKTLLGSNYTVLNAGVSGCTLLEKGNKPYLTQGKLNEVIAFKPDVVTIMLGTNDTKSINWSSHGAEFSNDYNALIDTIQKLSSAPKIWIVLPCPCWSNQYEIRDSVISVIIPILRGIAVQRNLQIIDANTPFKSSQKYFTDGVHPNAAGADSLAMVFYKALTTVVSITRNEIRQSTSEVHSNHAHTFFTISAFGNKTLKGRAGCNGNFFDLRGAFTCSPVFNSRKVYIFYNPE